MLSNFILLSSVLLIDKFFWIEIQNQLSKFQKPDQIQVLIRSLEQDLDHRPDPDLNLLAVPDPYKSDKRCLLTGSRKPCIAAAGYESTIQIQEPDPRTRSKNQIQEPDPKTRPKSGSGSQIEIYIYPYYQKWSNKLNTGNVESEPRLNPCLPIWFESRSWIWILGPDPYPRTRSGSQNRIRIMDTAV